MRLLLAAAVADSPQTGMGKWAHRVAEALRGEGHDVTLWFAGHVLHAGAGTAATVLAFPVKLAQKIVAERRHFDVVVVHEPGGVWYGLARKAWPALPPLIAMCHNVESKWFAQRHRAARRGFATVPWGTRLKTPLFRTWQTDGTIRLADHVICLSSEDERYLRDQFGKAGADVTRIVNGVASEDFAEPLNGPRKDMLFVGGWHDVKGSRLLPGILRHVRARFPQVSLTIAGAGAPPDEVIRNFSSDDRLSVRAIAGALTAAELRALYQAHQLFLMPSLSEGSPLSLLEAMAAGCPIVAAAVGGIPDIVRDGSDGLLFEPMNAADAADKIGRILGDPGFSSVLGDAAIRRVRQFPWSETARGVERAASFAATKALCHA